MGIIGFGAIGKATAKLLRTLRRPYPCDQQFRETDEEIDFIGTLNDLDEVLKNSDSLVLSIALNRATEGLFNQQKLELMKEDAVLVNVARGDIIDERALMSI